MATATNNPYVEIKQIWCPVAGKVWAAFWRGTRNRITQGGLNVPAYKTQGEVRRRLAERELD